MEQLIKQKLMKRKPAFPSSQSPIRILFLLIPLLFLFNSCMMSGMHRHSSIGRQKAEPRTSLSREEHLERMIDMAISALLESNIRIRTIAVWDIQSDDDRINTEVVKQNIIDRLVKARQYTVLSRDALHRLLQEQSLSLSGALDSVQSTKIGKLLGVDAFLQGYIDIGDTTMGLYLTLINSGSGEIAWSFTTKEAL